MNDMIKKYAHVIEYNSLRIFLFLIAVMLSGMLLLVGLDSPLWGDESHFLVTIKFFAENLRYKTILDYDQVTGPVFYIVYALWGHITSFEIADLRKLSLILSTFTFLLTYKLYMNVLEDKVFALIGCVIFLVNPYIFGLSLFIFTDILTLLFVILVVWSANCKNVMLLLIATSLALLTRQYTAFLILAIGLYQMIGIMKGDKSQFVLLLGLSIGCIPFFIMIYLWSGVAPPSGTERWLGPKTELFHVDYITTYLSFTAIYLIPLIVLMWRQLVSDRRLVCICLISSFIYFIFPVSPSDVAASANFETVGLAHKLIKKVISSLLLQNILLWFFFFLGLILISNIFKSDYLEIKEGAWGQNQQLSIIIICFFVVMPFSYQVWEKYLVLVLPFMILRILKLEVVNLSKN